MVVACSLSPRPTWGGAAAPLEKAAFPNGPLYSTLPLSFEANQGQVDGQVKFLVRGRAYTLFLTGDEAVVMLRSHASGARNQESGPGGLRQSPSYDGLRTDDSVLRLRLVGADFRSAITGADPLPGKAHYFLGNDPSRWHTNVPTYARVKYQGVYPGVDLVYYGNQSGQLEYDFIVAPGADATAISLDVGAALVPARRRAQRSPLQIAADGDLIIHLDDGDVRFHKPIVYQVDPAPATSAAGLPPGIQRSSLVEGHYTLTASNQVGFALGPYDHTRTLVIDPVLSYSSYLGGSAGDAGYGIAVDSSGDAYVTGSTVSPNFPITSGGVQTTPGGASDVFVSKFNPSGSGLLFSIYLGGNGADAASAILLDSSGDIYLVGSTSSTNFPTTTGALQTTYGGNGDAFLTELKPDGSVLVYSTYVGGSQADNATALALDSAGDVFLTGSTQSHDFPTMNPLQLGNDGVSNVFVSEVNPTGTALVYSTYLGGSSSDYGTALALDGSGNVYISGYTYSTDFPTQNAFQSVLAGGSDAFITELTPGNIALVFSTFLGGNSIDRVFSMSLDVSGSIYLAGDTQSTNFPVTSSAFQSVNHGLADAFVSKLSRGASSVVYSTLLGGSGTDGITAMALDSAGSVYLTGFTQSGDFPLLDPLQKILGIAGAGSCGTTSAPILCADAFVAKLGPSGSPIYSTFLGGSGADSGQAIVVDSLGTAYVAGSTASPNFPATVGALQWAYAGTSSSSNAFVAKIGLPDGPSLTLSPQQISFGNQALNTTSNPTMVTLTNEGSAPLSINSISASGNFTQTNNCGTSLPAGGATCTIQITFSPSQAGQQTDEVLISDNSAGSPHYITVTGNGVLSAGSLSLAPATLSFTAQAIHTTSSPQSLTLINNGNVAVTITNITVTGDFAETNTCGGLPTTPTVLNVGQACAISVTFTPNGSGNRPGNVTVRSNAANGAAGVTLTGIGTPEFTLSANSRSNVILIGTTSTTFSITASAPSSFTSSIALSCTSGATCSFSPSSILAGQSSTLTVNNLSSTTASPLNFTVTGTSVGESATVALAIFLSDFSVSATPSGTSVTAGKSVTYTMTVTPANGFNQVVFLSCGPLPANTTCTFAPPGVTLTGTGNATSTLTVQTTAQSGIFPWRPKGGPPGFWGWPLVLMAITLLLALTAGLGGVGPWLRPQFRLGLMLAAIILVAFGASCNNYVNPINITPVVSGTPSGNFTILITGTLGTNNKVTRATTINLTVAP